MLFQTTGADDVGGRDGEGGGIGAWVSTQVYAVELQASAGCRRARLT